MADTFANTYPTENTDISYLYAEKSDGNFVRHPISKVASSIGVTTGDIFYASATNTLAKLPIGTTGQGLTVSAGLPAWGTVGSTTTLIQRQTGAAVASIAFTTGLTTAYDEFFFVLTDVYPATNATNILMTISLDGGSNYLSGSYAYSDMGVTYSGAATASNSGSASTSSWVLSKTVGGSVANSADGIVRFYPRAANASVVSSTVYKGTTATNYPFISDVGGMLATASRADAVKFAAASGNINGTIALYGIKNT